MSDMAGDGASVEALGFLYRTGLPRYVRAAAAILGDVADGRDAVQDAFATAVRKRKTFRNEAPLEAWVWRIVINQALALRRNRRQELELELAEIPLLPADGSSDLDAAVRLWIAGLPERQRLAVFLRYFADLDYREIAAVLDVEVGTVSATLAAAHSSLRRSFEEVLR